MLRYSMTLPCSKDIIGSRLSSHMPLHKGLPVLLVAAEVTDLWRVM